MNDRVLIVDFGSQVTQLIARRVRESGVYCEIVPFNRAAEVLVDFAPRAVILSGGPASVTAGEAPRAPDALFDMGVPVLGICYGQQVMMQMLGGEVLRGFAFTMLVGVISGTYSTVFIASAIAIVLSKRKQASAAPAPAAATGRPDAKSRPATIGRPDARTSPGRKAHGSRAS